MLATALSMPFVLCFTPLGFYFTMLLTWWCDLSTPPSCPYSFIDFECGCRSMWCIFGISSTVSHIRATAACVCIIVHYSCPCLCLCGGVSVLDYNARICGFIYSVHHSNVYIYFNDNFIYNIISHQYLLANIVIIYYKLYVRYLKV
jgi:hypothetical protein